MSSLSLSKYSQKSSIYSHSLSSSLISKAKFIWRFPPPKFNNLPSCISNRCSASEIQPITLDDELIKRQDLAILIYDLGLQLNVSFTCIYTGVVYMHRFFMLHPFQKCDKELVAAACLFLSCKVNEMPRPLNDFTQQLHRIINQLNNNIKDIVSASSSKTTMRHLTSEILSNYNQQIIDYENMLLSTLGFCLNVEQPYVIITRNSQTLSVPKEIAQKAYDIATKSIFATLFSMKYTTNLIACFSLYLAITSSQISIPDNQDGSQWFHLFNEEFTEKLLQELVDEYRLICMEKWPTKSQQRFEQIRQKTKVNVQQHKSKPNCEQPNSTTFLNESNEHHNPKAAASGSTRSTISLTSIQQQQQPTNCCSISSTSKATYHHTPNQASSTNFSNSNYSLPMGTIMDSPSNTFQSSLSPRHSQNNFSEKNLASNSSMSMSSAKPIPILMTPVNSNLHHNSASLDHYSRFSAPTFQYPSSSPNQHVFHHPPTLPQAQHFQRPYSSNYVHNSSYYPQQQTPLFYHPSQDPSNINNKRYAEPPAPPMKRFRYNTNTYQHY